MTPEEKAQLERVMVLAEENNKILRGLRRSNRTAIIMRVAYWVVILALSFGAFYLIQPYFEFLTHIGNSGSNGASGTSSQGLPDMNQVQSAAKSLQQLLNGQ